MKFTTFLCNVRAADVVAHGPVIHQMESDDGTPADAAKAMLDWIQTDPKAPKVTERRVAVCVFEAHDGMVGLEVRENPDGTISTVLANGGLGIGLVAAAEWPRFARTFTHGFAGSYFGIKDGLMIGGIPPMHLRQILESGLANAAALGAEPLRNEAEQQQGACGCAACVQMRGHRPGDAVAADFLRTCTNPTAHN